MKLVKIVKINTNNMRNAEFTQFHAEVKDLVVRETPQKLKIAQLFDTYLLLYNRVDEAYKVIIKSHLTSDIQEADKARDEVFLGMVETAKTALKHFNPAIREAGHKLEPLFSAYGNLARKPLNEQTSDVNNLLQDLEGKYLDDATAIGLLPWMVELKARNIAFSNLVRDRFDETAAKCDIVLKEARAELDQLYFAIRDKINALVLVEGEADYEEFIKTLNAIIAKYTAILRSRLGRGKKSKEEAEDTTDEGTDG